MRGSLYSQDPLPVPYPVLSLLRMCSLGGILLKETI